VFVRNYVRRYKWSTKGADADVDVDAGGDAEAEVVDEGCRCGC